MGMGQDESVIEGTAIDPVCGMSVAVHYRRPPLTTIRKITKENLT
jgi:hypothetical protein